MVLSISGTHVDTTLVGWSKIIMTLKLILKIFHSSYATGHTTNLTVLGAAYQDKTTAITLGRSLGLFREGFR